MALQRTLAPAFLRGPIPTWSGRTTRQLLRSGVVWALIVLVTLGVLGVWVTVRAENVTDTLVNHSSPALVQAVYLETALIDQETGVRGYGLSGQPDFLQPYSDGVAQEQAAAATLRTLLADDPDRIADLDEVIRVAETWQGQFAEPVATATPSVAQTLAAQRSEEGKALFDAVRSATADQQTKLKADAKAGHASLRYVNSLRNWVFATIATVIALLAALIFEGLRRGVTVPLGRLSSDVRQVADGLLTHPVHPTGPADLRELASDVEAMRLRLVGELAAADEARRLLDEQAVELQRSNAELEQFAYVASHDLQEPLRKVASFCQLLERRYAGQLDERADQYIAYAVDGANRMQALIQDLLAFSRVGRTLDAHTDVDLENVFRTAADSLSIAIEETGAEVTHDPLPTVTGEPTQLGMLFQNLIGNAVKFRHPDRTPRVHVSVERDGDRWALAVADNGIGIEPEYAERVFTIFQRLHSRDSYPGNGIGLAVCKKIVDFHGGEIAVDPGHSPGTRIGFTLPAAAAPEPETAGETAREAAGEQTTTPLSSEPTAESST